MANQEITKAQIEALSNEAGSAGDTEMVEVCERALEGDMAARRECASVISRAQGMLATDSDDD